MRRSNVNLKRNKPDQIFRYYLERIRWLESNGECPKGLVDGFEEFMRQAKDIFGDMQEQVDLGYVMWVLEKLAWTTRIPPHGREMGFWRKKARLIEEGLQAMKELRPLFFTPEIISAVEEELTKVKQTGSTMVIYTGLFEHGGGSRPPTEGRPQEYTLNEVVFLLSEHFREKLGESRPKRIAALLNACGLDGYGRRYFDEPKVRQRIRRARLSGHTTYYEDDKFEYRSRDRRFEVKPGP